MNLNTLLSTICYPINDRFEYQSNEICLIYPSISIHYGDPRNAIKWVKKTIDPPNINLHIGRLPIYESYYIVAILTYPDNIIVHNSDEFRLYNLYNPYIIRQQHHHIYKLLIQGILKLSLIQGRSLPTTIHNCYILNHTLPSSYKTIENRSMVRRYNYVINTLVYIGQLSRTNPVILWGPPNIGKTSISKACMRHSCVVVEDLNLHLREFDHREHRGIIFENIDFGEVNLDYVRYLTSDCDRIIICDDEEVIIPQSTQLIFTTPIEYGWVFGDEPRRVYERCEVIEVKNILYTDDSDKGEDWDSEYIECL